MAINDEIVRKFRDELRRILMTERQSLKERIAAVRAQFLETMAHLEEEVDAASMPLAERLEQQLLHTIDPLISAPLQFAEHEAKMDAQIARLTGSSQSLEGENERLRSQNAQLSEKISKLAEELLTKEEAASRLAQERRQLDQRVSSVVEEYAQARANAARATRAMLQRLLTSLERIESKKSQVDILSAFLEEAAQYAGRVALFVAKGDMFAGWRSRGFAAGTPGEDPIKSVHYSIFGETALRQAFQERRPAQGSRLSQQENAAVLDAFGVPHKDSFVAIPLVVKDKSTAVLYADGGTTAEGAFDLEALELLVRMVALSIELLAYRARTTPPQRVELRTAPVAEVQTDFVPPRPAAAEDSAAVEERAASPSEAAVTGGFEPAVAPPVMEAPQPVRPEEQRREPSPPAVANEQELKLHNDAKRFARLLVSEIKLYNEQKVSEGRKNRDLYYRLKEDIDRSREMYLKRVSPVVSSSVDYFYEELVRTLGENDPDALGGDCPGPMNGAAVD
jgi:hypothetical protein